ncbi:MAG TPA: SpaA isopeptide-forming pilin-related protein, partial [Thermomicrobiales bacterium]|nr:SpaA isopeptide-forming pilin-related protein [Thermomicrobiales bacterium]
TSTVEIPLTAIPQPGSLKITKVDGNDKPLGGACFELRQNGRVIQSICDDADDTPNDGVMVMNGLDAGTYQLVETRAPSSAYQAAEPQTVTIEAGSQTEVSVRNVARPGRLTVITVKDSDRTQRLENACYRLEGDTTYGPFCDADDGTVDGRVHFVNVKAGDYTLVQTVAAPGFDPAGNRKVTIQAGSSLQVTVANKATPAPKETGTLAVIPLDENGKPVPGGCYQVLNGDTPITGRICDNADDVDARITFKDLPVGTFTVRELLAPSPDFVMAADQQVTIRKNETTEVEIPHKLKDGRVLVQAVNSLGQPLQGACFDLANDAGGASCSGTSGEVLFNNVPAGTDSLKQTQAPHGYKLSTSPRDVTVYPGQTTVVRIVFETAPPPDSGSVQVQKFFCPAGDGGERTQFLGGAQGNAELSKTAGCTQGAASFTLVAEDGSNNGPGAFKTGDDGRYQVTVKNGIYILTETDPTLGTMHSARLRVGVGQMTTVIVINYVAPPKPAPTNIDVTSFTCPPSFNGTSYADFAASCTSQQAKTNNLTVRVEGAQKFKQVTGDQGKLGQTMFENLPAGKYVVYGDKPYNVPIMYLFCGANASDPSDVKSINGTVPVTLQGGQTITCQFFLVPEQLSKDTGAILVQKFSCPIDKPAKGYDWANECERSTTQVPFSLGLVDNETQEVQKLSEIQANPDGLVRFINLAPGTYKLEEVGAKWCFAQSNSVDAKGNVVVNPNKLSEVWIYNCVGANQPPNTGSGDAARLLNPEGPSGTMVLLNIAWPAVALGAWLTWRQRHGHRAA